MTLASGPPPSPPAVTLPPITWGMILTLSGTVATGFVAVLWVLIGLVYGGLKEDIKSAKDDITKLSDSYQQAVTSGVKVQDLLARAPTLEKTINDTHDSVIRLEDAVALLKPMPAQIKNLEEGQGRILSQLDNLQRQVNRIPGMPK